MPPNKLTETIAFIALSMFANSCFSKNFDIDISYQIKPPVTITKEGEALNKIALSDIEKATLKQLRSEFSNVERFSPTAETSYAIQVQLAYGDKGFWKRAYCIHLSFEAARLAECHHEFLSALEKAFSSFLDIEEEKLEKIVVMKRKVNWLKLVDEGVISVNDNTVAYKPSDWQNTWFKVTNYGFAGTNASKSASIHSSSFPVLVKSLISNYFSEESGREVQFYESKDLRVSNVQSKRGE